MIAGKARASQRPRRCLLHAERNFSCTVFLPNFDLPELGRYEMRRHEFERLQIRLLVLAKVEHDEKGREGAGRSVERFDNYFVAHHDRFPVFKMATFAKIDPKAKTSSRYELHRS